MRHLHSGVLGDDTGLIDISIPGSASRVEGIIISESRNLIDALDKLKSETLRCMPSNVAVHEPCTWVIGLERDDEVSRRWKHGSVSTRRIVGSQSDSGRIVGSRALSNDEEIVTVEMNWVRNCLCGLDDEVNPFICGRKLNNVG